MNWLTSINSRLSRWAMWIACACLVGLLSVVVYGVVMRYGFNNMPPYVEQVALLLVISVSMFGASAGVRDAGHIGLDVLVGMLSAKVQLWCAMAVCVLNIGFGLLLVLGSSEMAASTMGSTIPTLGISEAYRYLPVAVGGILIVLFSFEHAMAKLKRTKVVPSWH